MRSWLLFVLAALFFPSRGAAAELWAGHQVMTGARSVPVLGTLQTRTDSFYLAEVERTEGTIRIVQTTCKMEIARFAGVQVSFLPEGFEKMPPTTIHFRKKGDRWEADPWVTEWSEEDVDGDGEPGATVEVKAPICGGTLFVGGYSKVMARGVEKEGGLVGEARAQVGHQILGTSSGCIRLVAKDSDEQVTGNFAYAKVPDGTTCESLLSSEWPTKAEEPESLEEKRAKRRARPR